LSTHAALSARTTRTAALAAGAAGAAFASGGALPLRAGLAILGREEVG
jgi:hypothetical protein